eukprot:GFUD01011452.1.p1 GENE.GFUD01011452.1~~GFUD01011452.1.p1  ORF type:complete len:359 (-),score=65.71 GFUD01011452.1:202-1278(-)
MAITSENAGLVTDLENKLPVKISKDIEENSPQFLQLLTKVAEKLDSSGRTQKTQRKLDGYKQKTEISRRKFLETSIRLETLNEVIFKSELNSLTLPGASHETALVNKLKENFTLAEVSCMLDLGQINGTKVTTLGLDPSDPRLKPRPDQDFGAQILPLVEDVLFDKCLSVLCLLDPDVDPSATRRSLHPQIVRLADRVSDLVSTVDRSEKELAEFCTEWNASYQHQCLVTQQLVDKLAILIKTHFCGSKAKHNKILVKYLSAKSEALVLKLRCTELEILNATYTRSSVAALRKIRNRLTEQMKEAQSELLNLKTTLEQYHQCGPEFSDLVREYARLQKEIEGKKWALSELRAGSNPGW